MIATKYHLHIKYSLQRVQKRGHSRVSRPAEVKAVAARGPACPSAKSNGHVDACFCIIQTTEQSRSQTVI